MNVLHPSRATRALATLALGAVGSLAIAAPSAAPLHGSAKTVATTVGDIVDVASEAGSFSTLLAAAKAAGLVDALKGDGPLTVLAPTDEAFAKLGNDTIQNLLKPENRETLTNILTYHVVSGAVNATDALRAGKAPSLAGPELTFGLVGGQLRINGEVNVVNNDIEASNGIIHVIDQVLIPPTPKPQGRLVIGFFSEAPGAELARYLGVDRHKSLLVSSVSKGSEAEKAGLKPYDLIVSINGRAATSDSIAEEKERVGYEGTIHLEVLRRGQPVSLDTKVGIANG